MSSGKREVKVVLLGDSGVGKTSLVLRFVTDSFRLRSEPNIGASFMAKALQCGGKDYLFQIWDTAGQEKYGMLAPMYYRHVAAAIVVYDITRAQSFEVLKKWVCELKNQGPKDVAIAIAGNKADLEDSREIDESLVSSYAESIGALHMETSAKLSLGVHELFTQLAEKLPMAPVVQPTIRLGDPFHIEKSRKKKCC